MIKLITEIAKTSIEFYEVKLGKFLAIDFDGKIVDSADSDIDLLLKIQGKKYGKPIFVWEVGASSFTGWRF
jgi:hypothetical protein